VIYLGGIYEEMKILDKKGKQRGEGCKKFKLAIFLNT